MRSPIDGLIADLLSFAVGARMIIGRATIAAPTIMADITAEPGAAEILEVSVIFLIRLERAESSPAPRHIVHNHRCDRATARDVSNPSAGLQDQHAALDRQCDRTVRHGEHCTARPLWLRPNGDAS